MLLCTSVDTTVEQLRREVRRLKLGVLACGVASAALGGAHVVASQPPDELTIGAVTITAGGITIDGGDERLRLRSNLIQVSQNGKGGVLLLPAEVVINDSDQRAVIRMQTFSNDGVGTTVIRAETRQPTTTSLGSMTLSAFNAGTSGKAAVLNIDSEDRELLIDQER